MATTCKLFVLAAFLFQGMNSQAALRFGLASRCIDTLQMAMSTFSTERDERAFEKLIRKEEVRVIRDRLFPTLSEATQKAGQNFSVKAIYVALDGLSARFTFLGAGTTNRITFDENGVIAINGVVPPQVGKIDESLSSIITAMWIQDHDLNNYPPVHEHELEIFLPWLKDALIEQPYLLRNYVITKEGPLFRVERVNFTDLNPSKNLWR